MADQDDGNISTCVEQTGKSLVWPRQTKKHLHMRGANSLEAFEEVYGIETSPHAWSKRASRPRGADRPGNISTCVEQTCRLGRGVLLSQKHLHMRGANDLGITIRNHREETSPHAWSKPLHIQPFDHKHRKHLHMRGANFSEVLAPEDEKETSPHAWSKHPYMLCRTIGAGNISTCVEQTGGIALKTTTDKKHLHMRGANIATNPVQHRIQETSPHAWSKLFLFFSRN